MTQVKSEMTRKVVYVLETDTIDRAHEAMKALNVRHVPVLQKEKLVGILSDRDILTHATPQKNGLKVPKLPVSEIMTREVLTCDVHSSVGDCADLMIHHKIDCLPVVDRSGHLKGILTSTDLLRLLRDRESVSADKIPFSWQSVSLFDESPAWRPNETAWPA